MYIKTYLVFHHCLVYIRTTDDDINEKMTFASPCHFKRFSQIF